MIVTSFNSFNYKANTAIVKSLQCQSDIPYLIEHWLSNSEENILQLIDSNSNIF